MGGGPGGFPVIVTYTPYVAADINTARNMVFNEFTVVLHDETRLVQPRDHRESYRVMLGQNAKDDGSEPGNMEKKGRRAVAGRGREQGEMQRRGRRDGALEVGEK